MVAKRTLSQEINRCYKSQKISKYSRYITPKYVLKEERTIYAEVK